MKTTPKHEFPKELKTSVTAAVRLEWLSLAYQLTVVVLLYLVMGSSQAMKTAFFQNLLGLIPPCMFLLANHYRSRPPTKNFPYGFHRVSSINFLVAAVVLLGVGGYLVADSTVNLAYQVRPVIGLTTYFGMEAWAGWAMIAALLWAAVPPVFLGRVKKKLGLALFDKILYTDAKMNKSDWLSAAAAVAGIIGVGLGWWWADHVAALAIAGGTVKDGWRQIKDAVTSLINRAPRELDGSDSEVPEKIRRTMKQYDWVDIVEVRLHEQGHLIYGEIFVHSREDQAVPPEKLREAIKAVEGLDWRLHGFSLSLVTGEDD